MDEETTMTVEDQVHRLVGMETAAKTDKVTEMIEEEAIKAMAIVTDARKAIHGQEDEMEMVPATLAIEATLGAPEASLLLVMLTVKHLRPSLLDKATLTVTTEDMRGHSSDKIVVALLLAPMTVAMIAAKIEASTVAMTEDTIVLRPQGGLKMLA